MAAALPKYAKQTYDRAYSRESLRAQAVEVRDKYAKLLPRGFDVAKLRAARVCNILILSYNAHGDAALTARVSRAVALLRKEC